MSASRFVPWTALMLVCLGGCGLGSQRPQTFGHQAQSARITVENNNWLDVVVFVVHGGSRTQVLRAGSNRSVTAHLPAAFVKNGASVRLLADFTGDVDDYWSEPLLIGPEQHVRWTLEENLRYSKLWIR